MTGKLSLIILITALAAGFCLSFFSGALKQKPAKTVPSINQNQINNQKQNPDENNGSIDLVRPPFLDE